jgi:hypothetical protein
MRSYSSGPASYGNMLGGIGGGVSYEKIGEAVDFKKEIILLNYPLENVADGQN